MATVARQGLDAKGFDPLIGQQLEQFAICQRVKGGLLNIVYQAHDVRRDQMVALKLLHEDAIETLGGLPYVKRLLQRWRQVRHPTAPRLLQTFECEFDGKPNTSKRKQRKRRKRQTANQTTTKALCWISPWINATPLLSRLQPPQPPLTPQEIHSIMQQLCEVLQDMHDLGLVHGQLRPEQLFLQKGPNGYRLSLTDLGWGEALGEHFLRHQEDEGTMRAMRFLAPEQLLPEIKAVPPQADVYASAAILFQLLTRRLPFQGRNWDELYREHIYAPPPRLNMACPTHHFNASLEQLMRRALAKQPQDRYPSIRTFWDAFDSIDLAKAIDERKPQRPKRPLHLTQTSARALAALWTENDNPTEQVMSLQSPTPEETPIPTSVFLGNRHQWTIQIKRLLWCIAIVSALVFGWINCQL